MIGLGPSLLVLASALAPAEEAGTTVRRFALLAAAEDGGTDRVRLRYAARDARAFARVLRELGGVAPEDEMLVLEPTPGELRAAFSALRTRLDDARSGPGRVELVVYYSGHSDAEGLLLGAGRFGYRELRRALRGLPADVRITILDSCASGAMTRAKGGRRRPPFVVDASSRVKGSAILTSSSEDEAAQESDALRGSYFTHALLSGLRGGGDVSGDGRVTLNEAYQFAFHETLRRTETTIGGAQHPTYDIRLSGSGDVVLTDVRATRAQLVLGENAFGRIFVRDADGDLAVELQKRAGRVVTLGLDPGRYRVTVEQDGVYYRGRITLVDGAAAQLELGTLERTDGEPTTLRGAGARPKERRVVPLDVGIVPPLSFNGFAEPALNHVSLSLGMSYARDLEGVAFALAGSWLENDLHGLQASVGFNRVGGRAEGVQLAVGANVVDGSFRGVQSGVGLNVTGGRFSGWQASSGVNWIGEGLLGVQSSAGINVVEGVVDGAQLALVNWAGAVKGAQLGLVNGAGGRLDGAQLGLVNGAGGRLDGAQLGLLNAVAGPVEGAQLGLLNAVAGPVEGAQLGLVNVAAAPVDGAQLGLVNVAGSVSALQIGLVNVVERTEGLSLGLLSFATRDGILDVKLFTSDVALGGLALELGTRSTYTAFSVVTGTWAAPDALGWGAALGGRLRPGPAWELGIELGTQWLATDGRFARTDLLSSARLTVGLRLVDGVLLYAGPALHVLVDLHDAGPERAELAPSYAARPADDRVYLWPGFVAGIQLF